MDEPGRDEERLRRRVKIAATLWAVMAFVSYRRARRRA
jgi:hypothetical protein